MRKVSFEGMHLGGVGKEMAIILVWAVAMYAILIKVFKWE
jgi:ABC-2 type transport system permease protein